ncbi:MAG: metallophosphoesterase [Spirochaetia bacterium]|jgi:putative phosphoesterase
MKIGILSDTHDHMPNIDRAVELFSKIGVEAVIHAGDFCSPFTLPQFKPLADKGLKMYAVFGNNDGDRALLVRRGGEFCSFADGSRIVTLDGRTFAVMHYPDLADDLFRSGAYDVVVYGHDHKRRVEGGAKKLINPGTCAGYLADAATVAVLETSGLRVDILNL